MDLVAVDPRPVLRLKPIQKVGVGIGLIVLVGLAYWYVWFRDHVANIEKLTTETEKQLTDIQSKKNQLQRIGSLRKQYAELQKVEAMALLVLPNLSEVDQLLSNLSLVAREQNVDVKGFNPQKENKKSFYAEVPVNVTMQGTYHDIAQFIDRVAKMERVVIISDLKMDPSKTAKGKAKNAKGAAPLLAQENLETAAIATTFRYLDPKEMAPPPEAGKKGKKGKGKDKGKK